MHKFTLSFLVAVGFCIFLYTGMTFIQDVEVKYKYRIVSEHAVYRTDSYVKSSDGCIQFLDEGKAQTTVCGNFSIRKLRD